MVDVSLNGAHLVAETSLKKDQLLKLQILFDELSPPINMLAKIVYHQENNYGLECQEIDIDSMLQLRSMLSLYNNDPAAIHRESQALWEKNAEQE